MFALTHGLGKAVDPPVTVIALVAVRAPSLVRTVIVAEPDVTPVTSPFAFTDAIAVLLLLQVTALLVAFVGETVAMSCVVPPIAMDALVGETLTPLTGTVALTVETLSEVALSFQLLLTRHELSAVIIRFAPEKLSFSNNVT